MLIFATVIIPCVRMYDDIIRMINAASSGHLRHVLLIDLQLNADVWVELGWMLAL